MMDPGAAVVRDRERADQGERCVRGARERAEERDGGHAGGRRDAPARASRRSATRGSAQRYGSEQDARDAILTRLNNVDGIFSSQLAIEIQRRHAVGARCGQRSAVGTTTSPNTLLRELADAAQALPGAELARA